MKGWWKAHRVFLLPQLNNSKKKFFFALTKMLCLSKKKMSLQISSLRSRPRQSFGGNNKIRLFLFSPNTKDAKVNNLQYSVSAQEQRLCGQYQQKYQHIPTTTFRPANEHGICGCSQCPTVILILDWDPVPGHQQWDEAGTLEEQGHQVLHMAEEH